MILGSGSWDPTVSSWVRILGLGSWGRILGSWDPGSGSWDPGQQARRACCGVSHPSAIQTPRGTYPRRLAARVPWVAHAGDGAASRPPRPRGRGGFPGPEPHGVRGRCPRTRCSRSTPEHGGWWVPWCTQGTLGTLGTPRYHPRVGRQGYMGRAHQGPPPTKVRARVLARSVSSRTRALRACAPHRCCSPREQRRSRVPRTREGTRSSARARARACLVTLHASIRGQ